MKDKSFRYRKEPDQIMMGGRESNPLPEIFPEGIYPSFMCYNDFFRIFTGLLISTSNIGDRYISERTFRIYRMNNVILNKES